LIFFLFLKERKSSKSFFDKKKLLLKPFKKAHDIQIRRRYHLTLILYKEGQFNAPFTATS